jgi:hypothetical protein
MFPILSGRGPGVWIYLLPLSRIPRPSGRGMEKFLAQTKFEAVNTPTVRSWEVYSTDIEKEVQNSFWQGFGGVPQPDFPHDWGIKGVENRHSEEK